MPIVGTAQLAGSYGALATSVELSGDDPVEFLQLAERLGSQAFDTAPVYPDAEQAIGLAEVSVPVHTKIDPTKPPLVSIQQSLYRLRRDQVDLVYVHDPDAALADHGAAIKEAACAVDSGFSKTLGASIYSAAALKASVENELIDVIQIPLNPMFCSIGDAVVGIDHDKRIIGRSALAQGLLATAPEIIPAPLQHLAPPIAAFQGLCRELERSATETALLWARDHPALDDLIVGAASSAQLREVLHILSLSPLSASERSLVDELTAVHEGDFDPRKWT